MMRGSPYYERANFGVDTLVRSFSSGAFAMSVYATELLTHNNSFYRFLCEVSEGPPSRLCCRCCVTEQASSTKSFQWECKGPVHSVPLKVLVAAESESPGLRTECRKRIWTCKTGWRQTPSSSQVWVWGGAAGHSSPETCLLESK